MFFFEYKEEKATGSILVNYCEGFPLKTILNSPGVPKQYMGQLGQY